MITPQSVEGVVEQIVEEISHLTFPPLKGSPFQHRTDEELLQRHHKACDWLRTTLTTLLAEREAKDRRIAVALVKEFKDRLIDIAITNEYLRGCVTSNQINELEQNFWASTHEALTQLTPNPHIYDQTQRARPLIRNYL